MMVLKVEAGPFLVAVTTPESKRELAVRSTQQRAASSLNVHQEEIEFHADGCRCEAVLVQCDPA